MSKQVHHALCRFGSEFLLVPKIRFTCYHWESTNKLACKFFFPWIQALSPSSLSPILSAQCPHPYSGTQQSVPNLSASIHSALRRSSQSDALKMKNWSGYPQLKSYISQDKFRTLPQDLHSHAWSGLPSFLHLLLKSPGSLHTQCPLCSLSLYFGNSWWSCRFHLQHPCLKVSSERKIIFDHNRSSQASSIQHLVTFAILYFFCLHPGLLGPLGGELLLVLLTILFLGPAKVPFIGTKYLWNKWTRVSKEF